MGKAGVSWRKINRNAQRVTKAPLPACQISYQPRDNLLILEEFFVLFFKLRLYCLQAPFHFLDLLVLVPFKDPERGRFRLPQACRVCEEAEFLRRALDQLTAADLLAVRGHLAAGVPRLGVEAFFHAFKELVLLLHVPLQILFKFLLDAAILRNGFLQLAPRGFFGCAAQLVFVVAVDAFDIRQTLLDFPLLL